MSVTLVLIIATGALYVVSLLVISSRNHQRFRGPMVVTCPETKQRAAVVVDATELRLTQCSQWPEHQDCGQECLGQVVRSPEDHSVQAILSKWYAGRSCAVCGVPIVPAGRWEHSPGLIADDGSVTDCTAVPGERLQETLEHRWPLCWNCKVAEEFRQRNPDLVTDQPTFHVGRSALTMK